MSSASSRRSPRSLVFSGIAAGFAIASAAHALTGCGLDAGGQAAAQVDGVDGAANAHPDATDAIDARGDALLDASSDAADHLSDRDANGAGDGDASDTGDACTAQETDCLDGVDNDCNGLVDCADPACGVGFRCVADAPSTWLGFALYDDTRASACPASFPSTSDTFESLTFAPATCSACVCNGTGVTCAGPATLDCAHASTCTVSPFAHESIDSACAAAAAPILLSPFDSCNVSAPAASGGACALASGGVPSRAAPSFTKLSRVCGGARVGGGCSGAQVCIAQTPSAPHGACILHPIPNGGSAPACPSAYPSAHPVAPSATSFDDDRTCAACACSSQPIGATCGAKVTLYGAACSNGGGNDGGDDSDGGEFGGNPSADVTLPSDAVCHDHVVTGPSKFVAASAVVSVASTGTCGSTGGTPLGAVTPKDQMLYCCEN
jgi:hypothetical protein